MNSYRTILRQGLISGVRKGMHGFVWMMKILVPISFATALLAWSGLIHKLNHLVQPVMDWLSLPGIAALPLLIGMLTGI
ncbi:MAG: iron transporter, partial [Deltaproteobacteria bacterium]|nr:iron transporter [Deltaproteobacteria bacterium]